MSDHYRQLLLCPQDVECVVDSLVEIGRDLGLLGQGINGAQAKRFYIGEQFLQHINFMGCAPAIEFAPATDSELDWNQFTFIDVLSKSDKPICLIDWERARPQCQHCKKRISQPGNSLDRNTRTLSCPHCGVESDLTNFNWREFGGCARSMISIVNVYPKEAIPTENLLLQFEKQSGRAWRYFYFNGPLLNAN